LVNGWLKSGAGLVMPDTLYNCIFQSYYLRSSRGQAVNWTWTNQYGSKLAITNFAQNSGAITGTYTNNAANSCDEGKPLPVTGWLAYGNSGTAISFSVNFLGCGSTTVWTGQLRDRLSGIVVSVPRRSGRMERHQRRG